jgi:hypothetical protein
MLEIKWLALQQVYRVNGLFCFPVRRDKKSGTAVL